MVKEEAEVKEGIVVIVAETEVEVAETKPPPHLVALMEPRRTRGTRAPGTRTCPRSHPASATGPMGNLHIFVRSQPLVPGRTTGSPSPTNEPGTSLARIIILKTLNLFTIFCILTITFKTRKYMKCF